jgi:hypothetical protein
MRASAVALALPSGAGERVGLRLSPTIAAFAPANLRVVVLVEPDLDNRVLKVIAESPDFYRSSERPLEGAGAPRTNAFEFRNLPSGLYRIQAIVAPRVARFGVRVMWCVSVPPPHSRGGGAACRAHGRRQRPVTVGRTRFDICSS